MQIIQKERGKMRIKITKKNVTSPIHNNYTLEASVEFWMIRVSSSHLAFGETQFLVPGNYIKFAYLFFFFFLVLIGHLRILVRSRSMHPKTRPYGGRFTSTFRESNIGDIARWSHGKSSETCHPRTVFWFRNNCAHQSLRTIHYWRSNGMWKFFSFLQKSIDITCYGRIIKMYNFYFPGWCRFNRSKNNCRHIRWLGCAWRWSLFWQRFHKSWQISSIRRTLGCKIFGKGKTM